MSLRGYLDRFPGRRSVRLTGPFCRPGGALPEPVVFVDRGTACRRGGEGFSVGDGDSHDGPLDQRLDPDKDYSDLAYVLEALPDRFETVLLLGFLGGRRDHELFNLGEAHRFLAARRRPGRVLFDDEIAGFSAGEWAFEQHGLFSLAAVEPVRVGLGGACRYRLEPPRTIPPLSSLGLSNRGRGRIVLRCEGPVFLFRNPAGK